MDTLRRLAVQDAPDPDDASRRADRFIEEATRTGLDPGELAAEAAAVLATCCQRGPYLAGLLAREPARLTRVASDPYLLREKPAEVMAVELAARIADCDEDDADELARRLRRYRADELVRLGVRELDGGYTDEVGRQLAHLADVCFDFALAFHDAALRRRYGPPLTDEGDGDEREAELVVIGMGKHGGEELNFSSDVDVIYIYSTDSGAAGELSLHEYFSKLSERVTAAIGQVTEEDAVFRVDLRLRPEGRSGPIANSLASIERYYETFGRPWERQAWLKARPCAGSMALGAEVLETLGPFIYPRHISPDVVEQVAALNRRIKAELDTSEIERGFDVKNGVGGIREIEFFVQTLQLVHGPHRRSVRARTTLIALDQLLFAGLISDEEHRALERAYRFLRHVEHALQLEAGLQTQRLPASDDALGRFARRLGHSGADDFRAELSAHTEEVARLFATLGAAEEAPPDEITALLAGELPPARERELLSRLGFRDPERAWQELDLARRKPLSPFGPAAVGAAVRVAPELLAEIADSPDPDQALRHTSELISRRGAWSSVWRLLDGNRPLIRLMASLFGTSEYLAKFFVNHPELIDLLVLSGRAQPTAAAHELERALDGMLAGVDPDDDEGRWDRLAEFKNGQILRIGLADVGGELDAEAVCRELSVLAEVCLHRAYELVRAGMIERHGTPRGPDGAEATLAICGLGKLGGRELGYASDLDVIFVYSGDGESDGPRPLAVVAYMTRLAQRLMGGLHAMHRGGRLYEIDTRLRPSGSKGLLVSSLEGWRRYHRGEARLWERQALIKLRPVAGDATLGAAVAEAAAEHVYGSAPTAAEVAAMADGVATMRDRIERELAGAGADLKAGRGGLIDVEFAVQLLQLAHGHRHPALRTGSTVAALRAAADEGLADPDDLALLVDGYRFLRRIEHRLRMVHDRSEHRLPDAPDELDKLARRAGYPDGEAVTEAYQRFTLDVRAAFERVVAGAREQ